MPAICSGLGTLFTTLALLVFLATSLLLTGPRTTWQLLQRIGVGQGAGLG